MMWLEDSCSMAINEWSASQGPGLWPLLNDVTWWQLFYGYQWMKCYPGMSYMGIAERCDLGTDVPWLSMNEVLPSDQFNGHYWQMWREDSCSMAINGWSATMGPVQWTLLNVATCRHWRQLLHSYQWMKCCPGNSAMAITEWCDLKTVVPWLSMNEVLPRVQYNGHYIMMWLEDSCSMAINEWSASKGPVIWTLLNDATWRQLFHDYQRMKCYPGTSSMAVT
jgi:hypothetical protein